MRAYRRLLRRPLAAAPLVALVALACTRTATVATDANASAGARPSAPMQLVGTEWLLEDLAGRGVLDRIQATLAFPEEGRVAGNASCNRFTGTVTLRGDSISFGPLAVTRMACAPAVDDQERRYLAALEDAARVAMEGPHLMVYGKAGGAPLRYTRKSP